MNGILPLVWLLVGGVLRFFDFGRWTIPLAAWLAPVFLIHYARLSDPLTGTAVIWLVTLLAAYFALRGVIPVPGIAYPIIVGLFAVFWTLPYLVDRLLVAQMPGLTAALVFPVAWVAAEYMIAKASPYGTWGSVAYTQHGNLPLMQLASVTGLSGITFLVTWFGSTVNLVLDSQFQGAPAAPALTAYGATLGLVLLAGGARLALTRRAATVRAAVVGWPDGILQPDQVMPLFMPQPLSDTAQQALREAYALLQDHFLAGSKLEARAGARIVVWPEINLMLFRADEDAFLARARQLAREEQVYLLMGMGILRFGESLPLENKAVLVDPAGEIAFSYVKTRPVPGGEALVAVRGDGHLPAHDSGYGRLTTAICFDMDFPSLLRQAGRARADTILVPASDTEAIGHLHHMQAAFRAVENGVSMLRATRWGVSAAIDPFGRTLATMDDSLAAPKSMVAQLPITGVATIYSRIGDLFAWLCVTGLLGAIVWGFLSSAV